MKSKLLMVLLILSLLFIFTGCPPTEDQIEIKEKVATPTFEPQGGTYSSIQSVRITCSTSGAIIYFTTDGSNPTTSSAKYDDSTGVFMLGGTLKAMAVKEGYENSDIAEATYTINYGTLTNKYPWTRFLGDSNDDDVKDMAIDNDGNIYITGKTKNSLSGQSNNGGDDILIAKYSYSGTPLWVRLRGGSGNECGNGIVVDSSGNVYVTGYTTSSFDGNTMQGEDDIFIMKYDTNGVWKWTKFKGANKADEANDIAIDSSGYIYIAGWTTSSFDGQANGGSSDYLILKYDTNGNWQWTRIFGADMPNQLNAISLDSESNIYVTGYFSDSINNRTVVVLLKYDKNGNKIKDTSSWGNCLSSSDQAGFDINVNNSLGLVYITGYTNSATFYSKTNHGKKDAFLLCFNLNLDYQWGTLIGGVEDEYGQRLFIDSNNNIYIVGHSKSSFNNQANKGDYDIFVSKYSSATTHQWTLFKGGSNSEGGYGIAIKNESVYFAGSTKSSFDDKTNAGGYDVCIIKIIQPE